MAVLFFVFAAAMGIATFIENDFGTQTSKALIYNTWWFEAIMIFFVINFFGNIFRYKLYKKEKWSVLLFHLAFLFILIGAGITRYISYEGLMLIDEGETSNTFFSDKNYLNVIIDDSAFQKETQNELLLSAWGSNTANFTEYFQPKPDSKNHEVNFTLVDYIPWAEQQFFEDENGIEHIKFVESSSGSRHEHFIKRGTIQNIHNILIGFDVKNGNPNINIFKRNDSLKIETKSAGTFQVMATQETGNVKKDTVQDFKLRSLYNVSGLPFVVPQYPTKGEVRTVRGKKAKEKYDIVVFDVTTNEKTERISLTGGQFNVDNIENFSIGDLNFRAWYGAKKHTTPFSVKLNDFQLEKYPGSENAASFASEVTVIDKDETFDFRIFMNTILNYKGYRLFQASYANAGEEIEQTHLSVNHDFWGTTVTYIGYFLLFFGLIASLFVKNTRFDSLKKSLHKIRNKKASLSVILLLISSLTYSQHQQHNPQQISEAKIDSILQKLVVSKEHADLFSELVIQDAGGRMKPAHTYASQLVRKVAHTDNFKGLTPSQILVSITEAPMFWLNVPFIYLEKGNTQIREVLNLPKDAKYARFIDFYNPDQTSKISDLVIEAQKKRIQNKFEQDAIKIERRH